MKNRNIRGFTLVELVATIIIIGIITVSVAPKFFNRSGFAEYALQDQIISLLRVAQQRAMYDHSGTCYGVTFSGSPTEIQVVHDSGSELPLPGVKRLVLEGDYRGLTTASPANIYFDGLGNALQGAECTTATAIASSADITVNGEQTLTVRIHGSGYINKG